ncbi:CoxG family protein [Antarcticimicrobium sediminis]|uniref:Carbon monoxide dehydrogenase n=1 Tax=Antarcticimicrobium sediminis TaxID=2546227 RepID=A0A4R5ETE2_9RHOB|nr:carbon monoxide dehydrogenase subunit G [Antarcticimicrobium sediminis]TDE37957.1 carbon monoxide dehydrogenase [Antarcticimicrobium sediminis]
MELNGSQTLAATPDQVWSALFDRAVLEQAIPGCESLEQTSDTSFSAVVKLKIGPVSARFKGDVELSDIAPGLSCTLSGKGSGGIAGFAKGAARVTLTPQGAQTVLDYTADVAVGGKLAALGNRLIKATAQKLTGEFFANFNTALTCEETAPTA